MHTICGVFDQGTLDSKVQVSLLVGAIKEGGLADINGSSQWYDGIVGTEVWTSGVSPIGRKIGILMFMFGIVSFKIVGIDVVETLKKLPKKKPSHYLTIVSINWSSSRNWGQNPHTFVGVMSGKVVEAHIFIDVW